MVPVQPVRQEVLDLQVQLEALEHQERQEAQVEQEALARLVLQELQVVPVHQVHRAGMVQVGVVDILQYFDTGKRMESAFKQFKYAGLAAVGVGGAEAKAGGGNPANISAVDPNNYAVRFMGFAAGIFQPTS